MLTGLHNQASSWCHHRFLLNGGTCRTFPTVSSSGRRLMRNPGVSQMCLTIIITPRLHVYTYSILASSQGSFPPTYSVLALKLISRCLTNNWFVQVPPWWGSIGTDACRDQGHQHLNKAERGRKEGNCLPVVENHSTMLLFYLKGYSPTSLPEWKWVTLQSRPCQSQRSLRACVCACL